MQVIDPVCGMQIDTDKAVDAGRYEGRTYYFCSAQCRDTFRTSPDRYANKTTQPGRDASQCCSH